MGLHRAIPLLRKVIVVLEAYSADARRVVSLATAEARQLGHARIGTEHLLLGLLADTESDTAAALRGAGATLAAARFTVSEALTSTWDTPEVDELTYTPRAQRALERAGRFARRAREAEVTPDHVLLGVLDVEGLACQVMRGLGVDIGKLRATLVTTDDVVGEAPAEPAGPTAFPEDARVVDIRPRCRDCGADLDSNLSHTVVVARGGDGSTTNVGLVYCGACGIALGAIPSG